MKNDKIYPWQTKYSDKIKLINKTTTNSNEPIRAKLFWVYLHLQNTPTGSLVPWILSWPLTGTGSLSVVGISVVLSVVVGICSRSLDCVGVGRASATGSGIRQSVVRSIPCRPVWCMGGGGRIVLGGGGVTSIRRWYSMNEVVVFVQYSSIIKGLNIITQRRWLTF